MALFEYYKVSTTDLTTISALDAVTTSYDSGPINSAQVVKGSPKIITICNADESGDACTVELLINSEFGTNITDTGTNANEITNHVTSSSLTLTVDGTAATDDVFTGEKVYKSDGTLFGTCTARNSGTEIVFGSGISQILADNDDLYTGTRYHLLHNVVIPGGSTLVLEQPELNYDSTLYSLKFRLTSVSGSQIVNIKVEY
tara:strand:+ start:676 stop:1278 length:603 start_codon:yes stop_codon:yes gene_type:complete